MNSVYILKLTGENTHILRIPDRILLQKRALYRASKYLIYFFMLCKKLSLNQKDVSYKTLSVLPYIQLPFLNICMSSNPLTFSHRSLSTVFTVSPNTAQNYIALTLVMSPFEIDHRSSPSPITLNQSFFTTWLFRLFPTRNNKLIMT